LHFAFYILHFTFCEMSKLWDDVLLVAQNITKRTLGIFVKIVCLILNQECYTNLTIDSLQKIALFRPRILRKLRSRLLLSKMACFCRLRN